MADWLPSRRALLWMLLAFVAGLIVFALVWSGGSNDFYRAGPAPPTAKGPNYAPLPAPLPADEEASGLVGASVDEDAADDEFGDEQPQLVETPPPPPPPPIASAPPRPPSAPPAEVSRPEPIAGQAPPPRYPSQALRRGERGTVVVRVDVGPDGVPTSTGIANGSGSRLLDRAAVDAVRRWRFRPAHANGQPTVGTTTVTISFNPN